MIEFLYEIIICLTEAIISGMFLINLFQPKNSKFLQLVVWCEMVLLIVFAIPSFTFFRIFLIFIAEFVFAIVMYSDKVVKKLTIFFVKWGLQAISSLLAFELFRGFIDSQATFFSVYKDENSTYFLLYLLIFSVFSSIAFQIIRELKGLELPGIIITLFFMCVGECTAVIGMGLYLEKSFVLISILAIIAMMCMVAANISVGMLSKYMLSQIFMANNFDYSKELNNMEFKYYEKAVENDKKLMSVRHDIANQIQTIYSLLQNGESEKGMRLINELNERYMQANQMIYCNNPVINVILSNKCSEAEQNGIESHLNIKDSLDNLPIEYYDLSTVICNLFDNAIRGCICSEQSNPKLVVDILQKNQYLVIRMLNTCKPAMNIENTDRIETTKSNSQIHGFGMPIIAGVAKKYKGDFMVSAQNGMFTATVVMSLKK